MSYATRADIEEIWGETFVADILPEDVDADASVLSALSLASNEIDVYLSARYSLPLATRPAVLVSPAVDIAIYKLANRHSSLTNTIEDRYKFAIALLERIADGKAGLGADEPSVSGEASGASSGGAYFQANPRLFTRRSIP